MDQDARGRQLHDRATRGEMLSSHEQEELASWYAALDLAEAAILGDSRDDASVALLRAQVRASVQRLHMVTLQIEEIVAENERLRRGIAASQRQLAQLHEARSM